MHDEVSSSPKPSSVLTMSNNDNAVVDNATMPPLPEDWGRCHAYNEFKRRYCRQMPIPLSGGALCIGADRPRYCGNHMHLLLEEGEERNDDKDRGRRVPCPIDPSHLIFEGAMSKHILICPAVKRRQELAGKEYFREGINLGGFGSMGSAGPDGGSESGTVTDRSEEAKRLAYAVLRVFHSLFLSGNDGASKRCTPTDRQLRSISESDIYDALPEDDLSWVEEEEEETCITAAPPPSSSEEEARGGGDDREANRTSGPGRLTSTIARHRVSAGGPRHLRQIASILGHARREGLISTTTTTKTTTKTKTTKEAGTAETADATQYPLIVEMGAGRGMTGLVVAGAMAAASYLPSSDGGAPPSSRVSLCLVERSGTRRKAETRVRTAEGYSARDCLRLDLVDITRVKCDLADVDMSKALEYQLRRSPVDVSRTVVIAKHLCGVGTDLAIMSIRNLVGSIDGCVMATCCHGLCSWNDYVGRDCLLTLFRGDELGGLAAFGEGQFNTLKRWTSAAVSVERPPASSSSSSSGNNDNDTREGHYAGGQAEEGLRSNIFALSTELGLACGGKGLGRACQRLIDYGRCEYLRGRGFNVKLCHYVPRDVTPQNALIVASR